jgi:hypothetical protein
MIANELSLQSLRALAQGEILAVCIPHFLEQTECSEIASATIKSIHFRFNGKGFVGLGPGFLNLPYASSEYARSAAEIEQILATPYQKIAESLGRVERPVHEDIALRPLTTRFYDTEFYLAPYQDEGSRVHSWASKSQLSMSLGLVSPKAGGKTRLWNFAYNPGEYVRKKLSCRIGLDEDLLPPHDLVIGCEVGTLTIVNTRRLHAVDPIVSGGRMAIEGYVSPTDAGVYMWS